MTPPNEEVCVTLPSGGAFCTYTMSDKERQIPKAEWEAMQLGRFSMSPESFGEYQKFIEQACEIAKCTKKQKEARTLFLKKVGRLNEAVGMD